MNTPHIIHNQKNTSRHLNLLQQLTSQNIETYTYEDPIYLPFKKRKGDSSRESVAEAHKNVVKKYYNRETITIFEDDIVFTSPKSWEMYWKWSEELPDNWAVYSGGCYAFKQKKHHSDNLDIISQGFGGLHWYTIRKAYYDKFLECPSEKHIDKWVGETALVIAPKLLPSRQMETFSEKDARSERKGAKVNYQNWRRRHKYLT